MQTVSLTLEGRSISDKRLVVEQVAHMFEQQRADIGTLLAALGKDISGEINGERLRFVDMMDNATRINIDQQMGRFKELFANEYHELLGEVNGLISKKMEAQMWLANYHMQDAVKTQQVRARKVGIDHSSWAR